MEKVKEEKIKKIILDVLFLGVGCALSAYASIGILIPNGLTSGGITGICRIIQQFVPIDFSILYYAGAFIILVACGILLGIKEARKILLLTIIYPAFLFLFEQFSFSLLETKDTMLAAIYYGVVAGIGCGLVFERGFSFGGTDTIAKVVRVRFLPFVSLSQILLIIDGCIIISSGIIFGRNIALYALVSQVIFVKVIDFVMYGFDSKLVQLDIITTHHDEVAAYIMNDIGRGVTNVPVTGEYTKETKNKIVTVCSPRESMLIKIFMARVDQDAFVSVLHVESVWGKGVGFKTITDKEK